MSRIGNMPITLPQGAKLEVKDGDFIIEGPKGRLVQEALDGVSASVGDGTVQVTREDDTGPVRARHGLLRALLSNAVTGVTEGFTKNLEIQGVGYRAEVEGKTLNLALGYSHPIHFAIPEGIEIQVEGQNKITVSGIDKQQVGQVAAEIRSLRKPDAYKGKGIRYVGEQIKLKVGKAATGAG